MDRKVYSGLIVIALAFTLSLTAGQNPELKKLMKLEYYHTMSKTPGHYLDGAVWGLLQTGKCPQYTEKLMHNVDLTKLKEESLLRSYLILMLPASINGKNSLDVELQKKYSELEHHKFSLEKPNLLSDHYLPKVNSYADLNEYASLLKNSIQLLALTVFEVKGLNSEESNQLLQSIDRMVFYFGEWQNSQMTEEDGTKLAGQLKKYSAAVKEIINHHNSDGRVPGRYAVLNGELDYLQKFFLFNGEKW